MVAESVGKQDVQNRFRLLWLFGNYWRKRVSVDLEHSDFVTLPDFPFVLNELLKALGRQSEERCEWGDAILETRDDHLEKGIC